MRQAKNQNSSQLRLTFNPPTIPIVINDQLTATNYFRTIWDTDLLNLQEQVYVVFLNRSNQVICWRCLHTGGIGDCTMDIRLIFSLACGCLASGILIAHNHPSGKLSPSQNDKEITEKIKKAGEMMDIELMDHLILTREGSYSVTHQMINVG